jgi:hypothetical protein
MTNPASIKIDSDRTKCRLPLPVVVALISGMFLVARLADLGGLRRVILSPWLRFRGVVILAGSGL